MHKPQNVDDYIELIDQAIFEIDELFACAEDEGDDDTEFTAMTPVLRQIEAALKSLRAEIEGGEYAIGGGADLPIMKVVNEVRRRLPIVTLIDDTNRTHKNGFRA